MALAQRFNVNTQSKNGTNAGTNLSLNDIVPIQPVTKGTSADDEKLTVQQIQSIPYGYGNLSGTTYTVTLVNYPMDFSLRVGAKMLVKFNSAKSGSTQLNLSINGVTVPMQMQGVALTEILSNQILEFTFIGTIANGVHTITSANASAGMSASQVNSALTDYTKIETITDANNGIPPLYQSKEYFMQSGTNRPASARCFIVSKRDTYGSGEATQVIIQSAFISDPNNSPYSAQYYRRALSTNNGSTWTWGEWQQLATESSVNTTLTDYFKVPLKQMNINSPYCDSAKNKLYYYRIGDLITIKGNFTAKIDNPAWNGVFVTANTNLKPQTAQAIKDFSGKDTLYIYTDGRIQNAIALVKDTSYYFEFTYIAN